MLAWEGLYLKKLGAALKGYKGAISLSNISSSLAGKAASKVLEDRAHGAQSLI